MKDGLPAAGGRQHMEADLKALRAKITSLSESQARIVLAWNEIATLRQRVSEKHVQCSERA